MKRDESRPRDERTCEAIGDVVARVMPGAPPTVIDGKIVARLERALAGERDAAPPRWTPAWRPWRVGLAGAAALGALTLAATWGLRARPLSYVETRAGGASEIRFSDGTSIRVDEADRGHVVAPTPVGATFRLDGGHASFAVAHRPGARWTVEAGPFRVEVTGTRFDVRWSPAPEDFEVTLHEGSVTVRGPLTGGGVPLRAGQRLVAMPSRNVLDVGPDQAHALPSPHAVAAARAPATPAAAAPAEHAGKKVALAAPERRSRRRAAEPAPPAAPAPSVLDGLRGEEAPPPPFGATDRAQLMNAGGDLCNSFAPQFRFETSTEGFQVATRELLALRSRSLDHTHSWCGKGSLRLDADFHLKGTRNRAGQLPAQMGQVMVDLGHPIDLTDRLVVVHVYVDAPAGMQFGVQVFAVNRAQGKWVSGGLDASIAAGRWWTVRHVFQAGNPLFEKGASPVARVDGLAFQIYSIGSERAWTGTVYIDDVGWR